MFAVQIPIAEKDPAYRLGVRHDPDLVPAYRKRDLATLNMFDFVVLFLLSNVVQNAIIGSDNSLLGASSARPPW
jgi:hypothetical protein